MSSEEFFAGYDVADYKVPSREEAFRVKELSSGEDEKEYLYAAAECWLQDGVAIENIMSDDARVELGKKLMHHNLLRVLLLKQRAHICRILCI